MKVLVTGATGFVGNALCRSLGAAADYDVVATSRNMASFDEAVTVIPTGDYVTFTDWENVFCNVDVVIHTAGRAHVMNDTAQDPLSEFRRVNRDATLRLAEAAANAGVKRFIFLSSIKVNGEYTQNGIPFTPEQKEAPEDAYGVSKLEAEQGLQELAKNLDMEIVIIRLPLVYGVGVKGNFVSLMRLVATGIPLPFGCITDNKRSFVYLQNLIDFIRLCLAHPNAANQIFLVSDDRDISTSTLVRDLSAALGVRSILLPLPVGVFELCAVLIKKPQISQRLCGSLQVDIFKSKSLLGWQPPYSLEVGLTETANHFRMHNFLMRTRMLRFFDVFFSVAGLVILWPLLLIITILGLIDTGSPFFLQERVGKGKKPFTLIKFRTMKKNTESVASHLVSAASITPLGKFLRKSKIDELPQLINVVRGEMSLVGPRPNLFNQKELMYEREVRGVYDVLPGITGLAQINNIDMSTPGYLAETDSKMIRCLTISNYFKYVIKTAFGKGAGDVVK
ncbi:hybrid nucleoside-diphosphate sugar epimerase/sugar transferase [Halodesulfovibrio aestuarii]|uniref:Hybrid nucleoside-diphosphate sugar epimerase/sugar transferase n=1 Tax=Halodesulfovibrio aestuarii TaxID=126333 RepID=A0ABV4JXJ9_9BACT